MKILIGVSDFERIKRAEIDVSNFAIFIGNNNSGKSSMLQLLYGLLKRLPKLEILMDDYEIDENTELEIRRETEWFINYEKRVNAYLQENKEEIIESIFHRSIPITEIYIKIIDINEKIKIEFNKPKKIEVEKENIESGDIQNTDIYPKKNNRIQLYIEERNDKTDEILYSSRVAFTINQSKEFIKLYVEREVAGLIWNLFMGKKELLFLPASKMGMQLLYKSFFAQRENKRITRSKERAFLEAQLKMPLPVYDFLQFLSSYAPNNKAIKDNRELTDFIEKYLINGRLQQEEEETVYIPKNTDESILLGLSPSVINELAPIIKALTGAVDYQYIFCDSVENCLDLEKQREMARLLIRLNNNGKRLIVSTYSETMLSEICQLIQMSLKKDTKNYTKDMYENKLDKLNLTEEDLPLSKNIHVYRFFNQSDGTSIVDKLDF